MWANMQASTVDKSKFQKKEGQEKVEKKWKGEQYIEKKGKSMCCPRDLWSCGRRLLTASLDQT